MAPSAKLNESHSLGALTRTPDYGVRTVEILPVIGDAASTESAIGLFREAVTGLGADAGMFTSYMRDDATHSSQRSLLACDPLWASEYARRGWFEHDAWLRHATQDTEPVRSSELKLASANEEAFAATAATFGFTSTLIAPAPSCVGLSRVGVLCLGSERLGFFDDEGYAKARVLARALAMELHRWVLQTLRQELLVKSGLTAADIDLLRHENAGHSSKVIGAALNIEAKTVDCRFQRVNAKLKAPDRRTSARLARLYGLL
jgi:hypothetical protein